MSHSPPGKLSKNLLLANRISSKNRNTTIAVAFKIVIIFIVTALGAVNFSPAQADQTPPPAQSLSQIGPHRLSPPGHSASQVVSLYPIPEITATLNLFPLDYLVDFVPANLAAAPQVVPVPAVAAGSAPDVAPVVDEPAAPLAGAVETAATALQAATPAKVGIEHVVIISIDGLRPDALAQASTPSLDYLLAQGSYSPNAQTVYISETLPSHASMLGGMVPEKHGILWGLPYMGWPGMNGPTLFSVAHDAGLSTAVVFGKEKLNYLILPNSVDIVRSSNKHDLEVKDEALEIIREGLPNVLFIHFPDTDVVGHAKGWMSEHQLYAVNYVDGLVGEIVAVLEETGYLDHTLLIVTADHGGHGVTNGDDSPEDRTIPWLAVGPGVFAGATIPQHINTYDTAATAAHALKLPIPEIWDGQPVTSIFETE